MATQLVKGTQLHVHDGVSTYNLISKAQELEIGEDAWDEKEVTPLETTDLAKEFQLTLKAYGILSQTFLFDPTYPAHADILELYRSGEARKFRWLHAGLGEQVTFTGAVKTFQWAGSIGDVRMAKIGVRPLRDSYALLRTVLFTDAFEGSYVTDDVLELTATFDEDVDVTGVPRIPITLDSGTVYATYVSGTGTNELVFQYTILVTDQAEATEVSMGQVIDLNGGTILDADDNDAGLAFAAIDVSAFEVNPA